MDIWQKKTTTIKFYYKIDINRVHVIYNRKCHCKLEIEFRVFTLMMNNKK